MTIADQPGCDVARVWHAGASTYGPTTVSVPIKNDNRDLTVYIHVDCD